jgi:hypothetical protein
MNHVTVRMSWSFAHQFDTSNIMCSSCHDSSMKLFPAPTLPFDSCNAQTIPFLPTATESAPFLKNHQPPSGTLKTKSIWMRSCIPACMRCPPSTSRRRSSQSIMRTQRTMSVPEQYYNHGRLVECSHLVPSTRLLFVESVYGSFRKF